MKPRLVFLIAFSLTFYSMGAAFFESFVNYPSWRLIPPKGFVAYHQFITPRVVAFLVAPAALGTLFTALLLGFRPSAIPKWWIWAALLLQLMAWTASATLQIPIQMQLDHQGSSQALLEQLIRTNFWLRRVPTTLSAILFLGMGWRVMDPRA